MTSLTFCGAETILIIVQGQGLLSVIAVSSGVFVKEPKSPRAENKATNGNGDHRDREPHMHTHGMWLYGRWPGKRPQNFSC